MSVATRASSLMIENQTRHATITLVSKDSRCLLRDGRCKEALDLMDVMDKLSMQTGTMQLVDELSVQTDSDTYVCLLRRCVTMRALVEGRQIHAHILTGAFNPSMTIGNTLLSMYTNCGSVADACAAFDKMTERNVVTWTLMINEYAKRGLVDEAFRLFHQMKVEGVIPNRVTFLSVLKACAHLGVVRKGKHIHAYILTQSLEFDVSLGNTLIDMYAQCGSVVDARLVFDRMLKHTVVSWNAMIAGYGQHSYVEHAFELFLQMELKGVESDVVTFISLLKACARSKSLEHGREIHNKIINKGFELKNLVGNTLVDMYAKCESLQDARQVFDSMTYRCLVSWNAIIGGYAYLGYTEEAFELFEEMKVEGLNPGKVTFLSVLKACASLAALEQGRQVHALIRKSGFELDMFVGSSLIDMYAKCGGLVEAQQLFDKMPDRSLATWNTMIAGYAQYGQAEEAFILFWRMQKGGVNINHITFVGLLSACSHAGLVEEGCHYFYSIRQSHGIQPTMEHYACMVDVLGRAGLLDEAINFIEKMPFQPSCVVWKALLSACRVCGDVELAEHAADCILSVEPKNNAAFVLMSNIYAAADIGEEKEGMP